jgi:hypothetical protein
MEAVGSSETLLNTSSRSSIHVVHAASRRDGVPADGDQETRWRPRAHTKHSTVVRACVISRILCIMTRTFLVLQTALHPGQVPAVPLEPRMAQLETLEAKVLTRLILPQL